MRNQESRGDDDISTTGKANQITLNPVARRVSIMRTFKITCRLQDPDVYVIAQEAPDICVIAWEAVETNQSFQANPIAPDLVAG